MRKENGMSAKAKIIKAQYKTHRITAEDVWAYADEGVITAQEAVLICGPRPHEAAPEA